MIEITAVMASAAQQANEPEAKTFFEMFAELIGILNGIVWGMPLLLLLLAVGVYLTFLTGFVQFRKFGGGVARLFGFHKYKTIPKGGDVSAFGALMTTLSSQIGTGNIGGVAVAIAVGGPGALFWMWIIALVGMATSFAEASLAVHFREKDADGRTVGGPMYYIKNGLGKSWYWLAGTFATLGIFGALGTGNYIQSVSIADALRTDDFGIHPMITGAILAILAGAVILGGIKRIASAASVMVPVMAIGYLTGGMVILVMNADAIPGTFVTIVQHAFGYVDGYDDVAGGFAGAALWAAFRMGLVRGIFSNEAGQGSSPIAHAAAKVDHPVDQGLIAMIGTFTDTIIVCSITGLVILSTGAITEDCYFMKVILAGGSPEDLQCKTAVPLTAAAFDTAFPAFGAEFVTLALAVFAFTTILGWSYYGERCAEYLFGEKSVVPFRIIWILWVFTSASILMIENKDFKDVVSVAWLFTDSMTGLMAAPNLIALILLSPLVYKLARDYFSGEWKYSDPDETNVPGPDSK